MKPIFASLLFAASSCAVAAPQKFSCEQIKDAAVRTACIADRNAAAKPEALPATLPKLDEKAVFIAEAKRRVADRLTDPQSAQFKAFYVRNELQNARLLCGMINAKNQHGGYVGNKIFYAKQSLTPGNESWETYIQGAESVSEERAKADASGACLVRGLEPVE